MRPTPDTLKLPAKLLDEIGGQGSASNKRYGHSGVTARKEKRKAERATKKGHRNGTGPPPLKRQKVVGSKNNAGSTTKSNLPVISRSTLDEDEDEDEKPKLKSILKPSRPTRNTSPERQKERSPPPEPTSQNIPRAVRDRLTQDDAEIAYLEKKLGIKSSKKGSSKSSKDDGFDEILDGIDDIFDDPEDTVQKDEEADWLAQKRSKARASRVHEDVSKTELESEDDELSDEDMDDDDDEKGVSSEEEVFSDEDELVSGDEGSFSGFESEGTTEPSNSKPARENPYLPPVTRENDAGGKYIPPSLRNPTTSDTEDLGRLRRQIQGLVNRLTESNLISILADVEKLYREHPRQHVSSVLVDVLLISVCDPTSLPDTLIILPAGFITAVYKVIGTDFGAQVVQRIVELFDEHYEKAIQLGESETSKETSNLITLVSELYNFQVIGSSLMFDYIRLFLTKLTELNAELLLKLIRRSGSQLRQDDPSALKDIVAMLRPAVASVGEENISVRTKFMIEKINDLKNNRVKTGAAASAVTSEHTSKMKKTLGSLNTRTLKASEPLRIGLQDIQQSDKKGKWWLVGASWAGNNGELPDDRDTKEKPSRHNDKVEKMDISTDSAAGSDLVQLAREHRMNTDIRRAIFITIMSSSDYQDAHLRLLKLRLKKVQEFEIPKVLIHCSCAEQTYNPFYTLIAKKLCGSRRLKKAFQFSLWNLFKRMGESGDGEEAADEDENDDSFDSRQIIHLAKMFGSLVADGALELDILKYLNLMYLQPKTTTFVEVMIVTVFLQSQKGTQSRRDEEAVKNILSKIKQNTSLLRSLEHFINKVVRKTDIAGGKAEKATLKWASEVAVEALQSWEVESVEI